MCLGIPGQVVAVLEDSDLLATVDVAGVTRAVNIGLVRDDGLEIGDWVLVHVGFALSIIDEDEARVALEMLRRIGEPFETEIQEIAGSSIA